MDLQLRARLYVLRYFNDRVNPGDQLQLEDIYVVWFSKTLQNWKALISTTKPDQMYYEVTYNGDKSEAYVDAYKKVENVCVKEDPTEILRSEFRKRAQDLST